jgi:hypothetical protein
MGSYAMHIVMSLRLARLANVFTLGACVASTACTPSDPPVAEREPIPEADAPADVEPKPEPDQAEPEPSHAEPEPSDATSETGGEIDAPTDEQAAEVVVAAPADYGLMKFPKPPPTDEELKLFGLAGYEIVAVYAEPNKDSAHLGFLRIGTRMRVGEKIVTEDCRKGWHALEGGGYACASRGLVVDTRDPFMSYQPTAARLDQPFPYDWAYVREWNTPMWWQVPSAEALAATREKRAILEAERQGLPPPGSEPPPAATTGGDAAPDTGAAEPAAEGGDGGGDGGEGGEAAPPPPEPTPEPEPTPPEPEPEEEKEPIQIPLSPSTPWLEKGFYLSLGETIREGSQSYWRTARGGIVEKSRAFPVDPKDYQGAEIHPGMSFPVGFVMAKDGTKLLKLGKDDKLQPTGKTLEKRTFLDLGEEVEIGGKAYFTVIPYPPPVADETEPNAEPPTAEEEPELLVKADIMRLADLQPIPKGLEAWDRWIDVDITKQMLVAYEGARPVYVTLVSTGKKGSAEEPFDTPTGRYRVYSKQVTSNMDGATATDGNYAIQDVPWVMYFEGSYALHGAFWHQSFGYVRSHGCVNLGPSDARWLFFWTTPFLPERWHGVTASDDNPGTTVIVRAS